MTRRTYTPHDFDDLAFRVFDLAAALRQMALACRDQQLDDLPLHDKKAREWLAHLDEWVRKSAAEVQLAALRKQASRRADEVLTRPATSARPPARAKRKRT